MNPIIFKFGNFEVRWYSALLIIAFLIGYYLVNKESKRFNIKTDFIFNMIFFAVVFGIIGARIYYVIFEWDYYSQNIDEILKIWNGGLAIHGGIIAGLLALIAYIKKSNGRVIRYLDFIVVGLLIGQAIGRWGNFFNQEAHGIATTVEYLESLHIPRFVINGMKINGVYYLPTFFLESILCLIGVIIICIIRRRQYTKVGTPTALYLIIYGTIRFFIENYRTDALKICGLKIAMIVSAIMIIVGIVILVLNKRKGKFEDLYNDKNNKDALNY